MSTFVKYTFPPLESEQYSTDGLSVSTYMPETGDAAALYCYPAEAPFDGSRQIQDIGPYSHWAFYDESTGLYFNDGYAAWENWDLTPGASGGAWLLLGHDLGTPIIRGRYWGGATTGNRPWNVAGLNSHTASDKDGVIYSPQFRNDTIGAFVKEVLIDVAVD